jgi:hypothetical protein
MSARARRRLPAGRPIESVSSVVERPRASAGVRVNVHVHVIVGLWSQTTAPGRAVECGSVEALTGDRRAWARLVVDVQNLSVGLKSTLTKHAHARS